jgi:proteasome lid subunit RPN8/RPN11
MNVTDAGACNDTSSSVVHVPRAVLGEIEAHAREEAPLECCGLLLGTPQQVTHAMRARNELASATRYRIRPEDQFAALRAARAGCVEVIGAYHSHPHSLATPSVTDRDEAMGGQFLYMIVGLGGPDGRAQIAAWHLRGGNFREVRLVPVP